MTGSRCTPIPWSRGCRRSIRWPGAGRSRSRHQDTDNARVFARAGITPNVRYTSVDSRATFAMVQAGLGVSLNNQLITRGWDTTGIVILPVDPPQYAEIGIAAPAPEELSPAAKRFLAFARQTLRTDPEAAELGKEQA